jgi:3'-phosphoadenosine 5'-phosphosulfate sulfotransferase (PAPS reductase)/FAD synthetase
MTPYLSDYDHIIVAFSGGKDSIACVITLLDMNPEAINIELWHHDVDGRSGGFMDWPCTPSYCQAFAREYDIPIYFSWLEGGFLGELLKDGQSKAKTWFETPDGIKSAGGLGKPGTRLKFPMPGADLRTRWCSPYLKIDVARMALNNQERFNNAKTLFIQGERAEESPHRAKYKEFEPHPCDRRGGKLKRHIDIWRPVHKMVTTEVWDVMQRNRIRPHPAYELGWGRLSCMSCIFGSPDQWASVRAVAPARFDRIAEYEKQFDHTIHRQFSIRELANKGSPYSAIQTNPDIVKIAMSDNYPYRIYAPKWEMPLGAKSELTGPQ